jgi:hypothetical protein
MSSHKTAATVAHTIGIDTGKNTLHLIGLDDKGAIAICARSSCRAPALFCSDQQTGRSIALGCGSRLRRNAYIITGMSKLILTQLKNAQVYLPRSASWIEEMEKRSRRRIRDLVALMAFGAESRMRSSARGYP